MKAVGKGFTKLELESTSRPSIALYQDKEKSVIQWKPATKNLHFPKWALTSSCINGNVKRKLLEIIAELPPALSRRSPIVKRNWKLMKARKFGYDLAYARPPTRVHTTCKLMSKVTLDLAQIGTSLSVMQAILCMKMNWQLSNSDIRWQISHNHLAASEEMPIVLPLHVSSVICHNYQHKNETTLSPQSAVSSLKLYVQAKSRSIDSCRNGTCADHYHKPNNVSSGTRFSISPPLQAGMKYLTLRCHIRSPFIRMFAILMKVNWQFSNKRIGWNFIWSRAQFCFFFRAGGTSGVFGRFRRCDFCLWLSCATSMCHDFTTDRVV